MAYSSALLPRGLSGLLCAAYFATLGCGSNTGRSVVPTRYGAASGPTTVEVPPVAKLGSIDEWAYAISRDAPEQLLPFVAPAMRQPLLEKFADLSPQQRLAAFRERGEFELTLSASNPGVLRASLQWAVESVALLEPAVQEPTTRAEAVCHLQPIVEFASRAERLVAGPGPGTSEELPAIVDEHRSWLVHTRALRAAYLAESLRSFRAGSGCFVRAVEYALVELPQGTSQGLGLVRLLATLAERDLAVVGLGQRQAFAEQFLRTGAVREADVWITRAREKLGSTPDAQRRQERLTERRAKTEKLAGLPASALHSRVDLLMDLDRDKEAKALLLAAEPNRPRTLRTAARLVLLSVPELVLTAGAHDAFLSAHDEMRDVLEGPHDELAISVALGLAGVRLREAQDNGALLVELSKVRPRLTKLSLALASYNPSRASALDVLLSIFSRCEVALLAGDSDCFMRALVAAMPRGVALKQKYPDESDIDRANALLAMFAEGDKAAEALLTRPAPQSRADRAFMLSRAKAAIAVASSLRDEATTSKLRTLVDDVPPLGNGGRDVEKELLLADWLLLDAVSASGDAKKRFERVRDAYSKVSDVASQEDRKRVFHNLAMIAARLGRTEEARRLLKGLTGDAWQTQLSQAVMVNDVASQQANLRALPAGDPSAFELLWKASVYRDGAERASAERALSQQMGAPARGIRRVAIERGLGWGGVLEISLGLNARGHELASSAYADLWLMPMPTRTLADVEKKGQPMSDAKRASGR